MAGDAQEAWKVGSRPAGKCGHPVRVLRLPKKQKGRLLGMGYGFIQPDDGGKDIFVHMNDVRQAGLNGLMDGQKVSYEVRVVRGKPAAVNLTSTE